MKVYFILISIILISFCYADSLETISNNNSFHVLNELKIFYFDSITYKYRELEKVGDEDYFSKPTEIDIKLSIEKVNEEGTIQVFIEELLEPIDSFNNELYGTNIIKSPTWILHEVLYSNSVMPGFKQVLELKNIKYKTAYFYDSVLYYKNGFRIVAIFKPNEEKSPIEIIKKEYFYSM